MSAVLTASLVFLLVLSFSVSAGQRIIRAKPGDNVILTCRAAENKDVIVVEWSRTDLESDLPVLLYRDNKFDPDFQSPSFINRVDLLDVENGDVSLVLKNVTTDDTGTYECRVVHRGNNRRKRSILGGDPICIIDLIVKPGNDDGGNKDEQKEDGGNDDGGNKDEQKEDGGSRTGWRVGFIVLAIASILLAAVGVILLCRRQRNSSPRSDPAPASEVEPL